MTDYEYLLDPAQWPEWPMLTMERRGQTGQLIETHSGYTFTVDGVEKSGNLVFVEELLYSGWNICR
jgi:hypothetical protein